MAGRLSVPLWAAFPEPWPRAADSGHILRASSARLRKGRCNALSCPGWGGPLRAQQDSPRALFRPRVDTGQPSGSAETAASAWVPPSPRCRPCSAAGGRPGRRWVARDVAGLQSAVPASCLRVLPASPGSGVARVEKHRFLLLRHRLSPWEHGSRSAETWVTVGAGSGRRPLPLSRGCSSGACGENCFPGPGKGGGELGGGGGSGKR